jgi:hypothetical protein
MAKYNGTLTILSLGPSPTPLAHVDNATFNASFDLAQATDKDSGGFMEYLEEAGLRQATIDIAGNADFTETTGNAELLFEYMIDRENIGFTFATTGGISISGEGLLNDLSFDTPNEETSTFTGTLTVNGEFAIDS